MDNSLINSIQSSEANRQLFAPVLNNYSKFQPATKIDNQKNFNNKLHNYNENLHDTHSKAFKYTLAGITILLLGGIGMFTGKGARYKQIKDFVFDRLETMQNSKLGKQSGKFFKTLEKKSKKVLAFFFNFDKIKDNTIMQTIEKGLGPVGRGLAKASKASLALTQRQTQKQWANLSEHFDTISPLIHEAKDSLSHGTPERELLEQLLKNPFSELTTGFSSRADKIKKMAVNVIKNFNNSYFPKGKIWEPRFRQTLKKNFSNLVRDFKKGDIVRGKGWDSTMTKAGENIKNTAGVGDLMEKLEVLSKKDGVLPEKAKTAVQKLVEQYKKATEFELDGFAGRALDLEYGQGLTETLLPPVIGAILLKSTMNGKTKEEKTDNFIKHGGVGFVGGLAVWMATMLMAINGPAGMLTGIAAGITFETAGRAWNKHRKAQQLQQKQQH